jgi:hypothetical protein
MATKPQTETLELPRLFTTIKSGFDTVANHITLILLPVVLDLFLWFGPHFSITSLLKPFIQQMTVLPGNYSADMVQTSAAIQEAYQTLIERFNLATFLRTFPIGLPSLMLSEQPQTNPLGNPFSIVVLNYQSAMLWWLGFVAVGLVAATFFFNQLSQAVFIEKSHLDVRHFAWSVLQVIILTVTFGALALLFSMPALILVSILFLINPALVLVIGMVAVLTLFWFLVPLLFSIHGVLASQQNALIAMLASTRLVRASLPGSALFLMLALGVSYLARMLWSVPPENSWLMLVSILGSAFINTALIASSFIYYREVVRWAQNTLQQHLSPQTPTRI